MSKSPAPERSRARTASKLSVVLDIVSEAASRREEAIGHMNDLSWLDDESVPASWLYSSDEEPAQYDDPASPTAAAGAEPAAPGAEPPDPDDEPAEPPWWLTDEFCGTPEQEHAAWLASLPADIRADYLADPYTGAGEAIAPGFTHHDDGGPSGVGFAAGGVLDRMPPGPSLAQALADSAQPGYNELNDSEQIGVLCGWQRQAAWAQAGLSGAAHAVATRRRAQSTRPGWSRLADHITDEVAVALRLTTLSAGRLLGIGAGLDRLPQIAAALSVGQLDWARATLIISQ